MPLALKINIFGDPTEHIYKSGFWLVKGITLEHIQELYNNNIINMRRMELEKVAETYMGMGYGLGVYYDYMIGQFVIFLEGGSNGYDVVENTSTYANYISIDTQTARKKELNRYLGARATMREDIYNFFTDICPHEIQLADLKEWVIMSR